MRCQILFRQVVPAVLCLVVCQVAAQAQDVFTSPDFLAANGVYNTPSTTVFPAFSMQGFVITGFSDEEITASGADDIETASAYLSGILQPAGRGPLGQLFVGGAGTLSITIFNGAVDGYGTGATGSFNMQLSSFDFTLVYPVGSQTLQFTADPSAPSLGQGSSAATGGGLFQINSDFDVNADLSVNGGPETAAIGSPTQITLNTEYVVAEPATFQLALMSLGLIGLGRIPKRDCGMSNLRHTRFSLRF